MRRPNPHKGIGQSAAASLLQPAAVSGLRAPLAGDQVGGCLALAVAFRTIFAKQSLVSTLQMKWPARGHRF